MEGEVDPGAIFNDPNGGSGSTLSRRLGEAACVTEVSQPETIPLDIYVLFDQSGSMLTPAGQGTRLDAVRAASADFLRSSESRGMGVGIGYFGYHPIGSTSCDPKEYDEPSVAIAELPNNADSLLSSLNSVEPTGETPTGPAIEGACSVAKKWHDEHPAHAVVLLVMTDGVPEAPISMEHGCAPTLDDAVKRTERCAVDGEIPVYVIGVGPSLANLHRIAEAGGTGEAYLVEGGDVSSRVLEALRTVRGSAQIPCEFLVPSAPPGEDLNYDQVNVIFDNGDGRVDDIFYVREGGQCDSTLGGWYYDDPANPTRIVLCDSTCDLVESASSKGKFSFALGCDTLSPIQ